MSNVINLVFESTIIRSVEICGSTWFVVRDIYEALGYSSGRQPRDKIFNSEKKLATFNTDGGDQKMLVTNKTGMIELILSSRMESAKAARISIIEQVMNSDAVVRALADFEIPDDLPDMYVYAIRNTLTGNIKLGISRDPVARMAQLQTGNDCRLELAAYRKAENRFSDEAALHLQFANVRVSGEWFQPDAIEAFISSPA